MFAGSGPVAHTGGGAVHHATATLDGSVMPIIIISCDDRILASVPSGTTYLKVL